MNDQTSTFETASETSAEKSAPREIIRGRMPVAVVALARFGSMKDAPTKAVAEAFGTTIGKIDDIRKNRNFAYVTESFRPTEQQKADGIAWLERHPTGAQALIDELKAMEVATPEQAAEFEQLRAANRGQSNKTKDGEEANAGGGNRRGKKAKSVESQADVDADSTADALLS